MRGERERLSKQLKAVFAEIAQLTTAYRAAIERLEASALPNLSAQSAAQWFQLVRRALLHSSLSLSCSGSLIGWLTPARGEQRKYLRVVDLKVQIRRGEIRHRTTRRFQNPCMHTTGTKGALHSGVSIDDGDALLRRLEKRSLAREAQLELWITQMDGLDRDGVGQLDKQLKQCLDTFLGLQSAFFTRLEVSGEDPNEQLLVFGASGGPKRSRVVEKVSRMCRGPGKCRCVEDAEPWVDFSLQAGDTQTEKRQADSEYHDDEEAGGDEDVGILAIKRKWGFDQLAREEDSTQEAVELARAAAELTRRRRIHARGQTSAGGVRLVPTARNLYMKKCETDGTKPKAHILTALTVKNGALRLDLSAVGFHSAEDLADLAEILSSADSPELPPVLELNLATGFFNAMAFKSLCQLLRVPHLRQTVEKMTLRGLALPQREDLTVLLRLINGVAGNEPGGLGGLVQLKILDLSHNTMWKAGAGQLKALLASLPRLENLSLESCFPPPESSQTLLDDQWEVKDLVRGALTTASTRLRKFVFGSNCVDMSSGWIDALFTPESALHELCLRGLSSPTTPTERVNGALDGMEVDWQATDAWDVQQLELLSWSSGSSVLSAKLFDALGAGLQNGFAQLKHLQLTAGATENDGNDQNTSEQRRGGEKTVELMGHIATYGVLKSCNLNLLVENANGSEDLLAATKHLLTDGLRECESLRLRLPHLRLTIAELHDLVASVDLPKVSKMHLTVALASNGGEPLSFGGCFKRERILTLQDFTLELHVPLAEQDTSLVAQPTIAASVRALVRELETSWAALDSSQTREKRQCAFSELHAGRRQPNQSMGIYRCRFGATI